MVIESKGFYNHFVDFAFFVVKNRKAAKDAKSAKGVVEGRWGRLGDGAPRAKRGSWAGRFLIKY